MTRFYLAGLLVTLCLLPIACSEPLPVAGEELITIVQGASGPVGSAVAAAPGASRDLVAPPVPPVPPRGPADEVIELPERDAREELMQEAARKADPFRVEDAVLTVEEA